jgi:hypothetical protein
MNSKVAHEHTEHREHDELILVWAPECKTLRLVVGGRLLDDCVIVQGSPRPPYSGLQACGFRHSKHPLCL